MEYSIIKTGGKQYKVSKDSIIDVERLPFKENENFSFDEILLHVADKKVKLGKPKIAGAGVKAIVVKHLKGDKVRVSKFKAKAKYRRTTGHRQSLTRVKILDVLTAVKN